MEHNVKASKNDLLSLYCTGVPETYGDDVFLFGA